MGWSDGSGLGVKQNGRISLSGLIGKDKPGRRERHHGRIAHHVQVEAEYNRILQERKYFNAGEKRKDVQ